MNKYQVLDRELERLHRELSECSFDHNRRAIEALIASILVELNKPETNETPA